MICSRARFRNFKGFNLRTANAVHQEYAKSTFNGSIYRDNEVNSLHPLEVMIGNNLRANNCQ
jgi:hypothetical protein